MPTWQPWKPCTWPPHSPPCLPLKKKAPHPPTLRAAEGAYADHAREQARQEYETFLQEAARNEALKDCQCETCGGAMEVRGFLPFTLTTQLGPVPYTRRVYRCPHGHGGYAPFDRALGVYHHASPGMQPWMCFTAAKEAFHGAAETIHVLSGVAVSTAVVQAVAEWHGAQERARHEAATRRVFTPAQRPPEPAGPACLYIQVDGAHVPMRTKDTFHECSVAVLFEPPPDEHAHPVRAQYLAGMESWEAFGEKLFAAAWGRGVRTARNVVFMGDGATSNWSIAEMHFPHATQIVDFYHASEHIHAARLLGWGADDPGGQTWVAEQCHRLKHGAWDAFVAAFEQLPGATALQREKRDAALRYFVHNKQRMQYARYRARGLYIGSGMVESGCKLIVTQRMKITGAHWDEPGAQAMVHLRAAYLNGAFRSDWVLRLAA